MKALASGGVAALSRRLDTPCDPLTLYAALSDGGTRVDTALFERSVGPGMILDRAALRAECRGPLVTLAALSEGGRNLIAAAGEALVDHVARRDGDMLTLRFPPASGVDAEARLTAPSPFDALRFLTGLSSLSPEEPFAPVCIGTMAYDHVDLFETLPAAASDPLDHPDFLFWIAESLVLFEPGARPRAICTAFGGADAEASRRAHFAAAERLAALVARCAAAAPYAPPPAPAGAAAAVDLDDDAFARLVDRMKGHIADGDVYQIVPSRRFSTPCPDPLAAYARLRATDPSPYHFFIAGGRHLLFGASPETSVRVFREGAAAMVEVKPIAGTRPRGADGDADDRMEAELRLDRKEAAEHMMLVDLARNDVARVSVPGTRRVAKLMTVERYARVMHLVSSVTGRLREGLDALHALAACLNVGTLTGAPKIRATELLRAAEPAKRGPYGGAVGWIAGDGRMDTAVIIRSALVIDGTAHVRAGAGVVHDSDPAAEADETRRKASAILSALGAM